MNPRCSRGILGYWKLLYFYFSDFISEPIFLFRFKAVRVLARMCPYADSYELSLHVLYFVFQSTIIGLDNTIFERIIVNILWKIYLDLRMSRFKAVRVLTRMCPCADSYEPSLLERNIRLLKIVILLFSSVRFYFSANFLSRFKAVRVLARMRPCADSHEPSLLERNIRLLKIVIFLFFSVRFYFSAHFLSCFKAVRFLTRMCPCAGSYELSLHVLYFVIQSTILCFLL